MSLQTRKANCYKYINSQMLQVHLSFRLMPYKIKILLIMSESLTFWLRWDHFCLRDIFLWHALLNIAFNFIECFRFLLRLRWSVGIWGIIIPSGKEIRSEKRHLKAAWMLNKDRRRFMALTASYIDLLSIGY